MKSWTASIRRYPHFDPVISATEAEAVALDPRQVSSHKFYPFLKYDEGWTAYARKGEHGKRKDRPIRFAARLDSCIFSYYRSVLSKLYEERLAAEGLGSSVIAYRRILKSSGSGGQSNIEFALTAVQSIRSFESCCTVALDISSFFESLDHDRLREVWKELIGESRLPQDHFTVFRAITKYAFVNVKSAYERLGYYGEKTDRYGKVRLGYLKPKKEIPVQLCDGKTFREKIAGKGTLPSIIEVNKTGKGVPQGAPLSDLLANLYLFEFDKYVQNICNEKGGSYFRYSDDILIVAPISETDAISLEQEIRTAVGKFGEGLLIKEEKSAIHKFERTAGIQVASVIKASDKDGRTALNKPFEYLGFRYDGKSVFIRDKTMSNLHRKIASVCHATAIRLVKRYKGKSVDEILKLTDIEKLIQTFGPVKDFRSKVMDYRLWTFTTYAKRASRVMGNLGSPIPRQLSGLRRAIRNRLEFELQKLV